MSESVTRHSGMAVHSSAFRPVRLVDVELSLPVAPLVPIGSKSGVPYGSALVLARMHGEPLGLVNVPLHAGGCSAESLKRAILRALSLAIDTHLRDDGVSANHSEEPMPPCVRRRSELLQDAPAVTVVIPTRARAEQLEHCLASILSGSYPRDRLEIVVVDNAPSDAPTQALTDRLAGDGHLVRYVAEETPGSASARNTGLRIASGELVAFTDDDVVVDHHWLAELAVGFGAAPQIDCVTGLVVPIELETPAQLWFEQYGGFGGLGKCTPRVFDVLRPFEGAGPLFPYAAGIYGTGGNMAFRRSTLSAIGGFDPALGNGTPALGGCDGELLLRAVLTGHRLHYRPSAFVRHRHRPDYAGLHRQVYCYGVGLTAYLTKTMVTYPRLIPDIVKRVPSGLKHAIAPGSPLHEQKDADFPRALTLAEIRGMLYGPLAYARSRRRFGAHRPPRGCAPVKT